MTKKRSELPESEVAKYEYEDKIFPVDELFAWPGNARRADVDKIAAGIRKFGFYGKLIVQRGTNRIIIGNHRWMAAKQVGLEHIPGQVVEMSDSDAERMNAWDNKISDDAEYDEVARIKQLEALARTDEGLAHTGYDADELAGLILKQGREENDFPEEPDFPALGDAKQRKDVICPNCDYHFDLRDAEYEGD
jgi:ParB-like chromosome segregation protein Spo0J